MRVFLRNIPGDTLRKEIVDFIVPALKAGFLRAKGEIKNISFLMLKDKTNNLMEYHAIVQIEPDAAALRVIRKLHGQRLRDKRIAVRKYHLRSWKNDKRLPSKDTTEVLNERRKTTTRRRELEVMEGSTPQYSTYKSFHRIY